MEIKNLGYLNYTKQYTHRYRSIRTCYKFKISTFDFSHSYSLKKKKLINTNSLLVKGLAIYSFKVFEYFRGIKLLKSRREDEFKFLLGIVYLYSLNCGFHSIDLANKSFLSIIDKEYIVKSQIILLEYFFYKGKNQEVNELAYRLIEQDIGVGFYYLAKTCIKKSEKIDLLLEGVVCKYPAYECFLDLFDLKESKMSFLRLAISSGVYYGYYILGYINLINKRYAKAKTCYLRGIRKEVIPCCKGLFEILLIEDDQDFIGYRKIVFQTISLRERRELIVKLIEYYLDKNMVSKAISLAKIYQKYDYLNGSIKLAALYEQQKNYLDSYLIYKDLSENRFNNFAKQKLGEFYIFGYGVVRVDEKKGLKCLVSSGTKRANELLSIICLKGYLGKSYISYGFNYLNSQVYKSELAAKYIYACYYYHYYVYENRIELKRLHNILVKFYKKSEEELISFIIDNIELKKKNKKHSSLANMLLI